jgi:hypothetical protein
MMIIHWMKTLLRRFFGPRHTLQSVARTLYEGLLDGSIVLEDRR